MAVTGGYATLKTALETELASICPAASNPVENADLAIDINSYCEARQAEALLLSNHLTNRTMAGQTFGYRDAGTASRIATTLAAKLTRAGFSLNVGATVIADLRGENEVDRG